MCFTHISMHLLIIMHYHFVKKMNQPVFNGKARKKRSCLGQKAIPAQEREDELGISDVWDAGSIRPSWLRGWRKWRDKCVACVTQVYITFRLHIYLSTVVSWCDQFYIIPKWGPDTLVHSHKHRLVYTYKLNNKAYFTYKHTLTIPHPWTFTDTHTRTLVYSYKHRLVYTFKLKDFIYLFRGTVWNSL